VYENVVGKPKEKKPVEKLGCRWEDLEIQSMKVWTG
jgi:hypothetical protein